MSINCIALGKRICFYRLKFNITQEKLAALTNCSREYIAYLESGTKTPSLPTLIDLANVLHSAIFLLTGRSISLPVRWVPIMTATNFSEFLQKMQGLQSRTILIGQ